MSEWKPIKTAPMNGDLVLVGAWVNGGWLYMDIARRQPYSPTDFETQNMRAITTATHWAPIPEFSGNS